MYVLHLLFIGYIVKSRYWQQRSDYQFQLGVVNAKGL